MIKTYLLILVVFLFAHCGEDQTAVPASRTPIDWNKAVVENITGHLIASGMSNLVEAAEQLSLSSQQACSAEGIETQILRDDWKKSMQVFHYLEAVPFGAFSAKKIAACEDSGALACRIYSFPMIVNERSIRDHMAKSKSAGKKFQFPSESMNVIGLDGLEYILFEVLQGETTVDASSVACPYLQFLAADIAEAASSLGDSFESSQQALLTQDTSDSEYKKALVEIADSFSFFKQTFLYKKVNRFMGLPGSSREEQPHTCQDCSLEMEHPWALLAKEALLWNLESLRLVYSGDTAGPDAKGEGFGIQDYLEQSGHEEASEFPLIVSQKVIDALETFESDMEFRDAVDELAGERCVRGVLCELQVQTRSLAVWLTNDLLALLSVDANRAGVEGDGD